MVVLTMVGEDEVYLFSGNGEYSAKYRYIQHAVARLGPHAVGEVNLYNSGASSLSRHSFAVRG